MAMERRKLELKSMKKIIWFALGVLTACAIAATTNNYYGNFWGGTLSGTTATLGSLAVTNNATISGTTISTFNGNGSAIGTKNTNSLILEVNSAKIGYFDYTTGDVTLGLINTNSTNVGAGTSVLGGYGNIATNLGATIVGGVVNSNFGFESVIVGGFENLITGNNAFAAGYLANATNPGSFVWSDFSASTSGAFSDTATNQFAVRSVGGVRFVASGAGMTLDGNEVLTNGVSVTNLTGSLIGGLPTVTLISKNIVITSTNMLGSNSFLVGWNVGTNITTGSPTNLFGVTYATAANHTLGVGHFLHSSVAASVVYNNGEFLTQAETNTGFTFSFYAGSTLSVVSGFTNLFTITP